MMSKQTPKRKTKRPGVNLAAIARHVRQKAAERTEPRRVQFATDKRRVEITGGKYRGDLGHVWFKDGKPERKVDKDGIVPADGRWARKFLQVTFDSGFTRIVQGRFVRVLADVEILYIEADEDMPDPPPRLEDVPVGPVSILIPTKPRVRKLGDPPRLEDLEHLSGLPGKGTVK